MAFKWILVLMILIPLACKKAPTNNDTLIFDPPADHTVNKRGVLHKEGLSDPMSNCVECHGADLKGGSSRVSCFACHGKLW